jgi:hypothetical protein
MVELILTDKRLNYLSDSLRHDESDFNNSRQSKERKK